MSKKELESAVNNYVKAKTDNEAFPIGWVAVVSLAPSEGSQGVDSYLTIHSDGMQLHTLLGLLDVAQSDTRANMMLSSISQSIMFLMGDDDDDE